MGLTFEENDTTSNDDTKRRGSKSAGVSKSCAMTCKNFFSPFKFVDMSPQTEKQHDNMKS